jgi:hypothetical protein
MTGKARGEERLVDTIECEGVAGGICWLQDLVLRRNSNLRVGSAVTEE